MASHTTSNNQVVAVIFDWAGTTVDHGSLAPVEAIRQLFAGRGVQLTHDQIRKDMGLHKRDHIRRLLSDTAIQGLWKRASGQLPSEVDIEALFAEMVDVQIAVLARYSRIIDGIPETVQALRAKGIKIGSTTGYARDMMKPLIAATSAQGYSPDCVVCPEDAGQGRPFPWMIYTACMKMQAYPLWKCVKVGDTVSDVEEGRNAGTWTVGISRTGNLVGLSEKAWSMENEQDQRKLLEIATERFKKAKADFVVESASDLSPVIEQIENRIAAGQLPGALGANNN
jgi:phosphonoacetaldehyde hydrolase